MADDYSFGRLVRSHDAEALVTADLIHAMHPSISRPLDQEPH